MGWQAQNQTQTKWPWNNDLENRTWPRYFEDVHPHWKWSCQVKPFKGYCLKQKKYENSSRSNVTNFQPRLGFTMGHTPTKLHQFLTGRFCVDRQTDTTKNNTYFQYSWRAGNEQLWMLPYLMPTYGLITHMLHTHFYTQHTPDKWQTSSPFFGDGVLAVKWLGMSNERSAENIT